MREKLAEHFAGYADWHGSQLAGGSPAIAL